MNMIFVWWIPFFIYLLKMRGHTKTTHTLCCSPNCIHNSHVWSNLFCTVRHSARTSSSNSANKTFRKLFLNRRAVSEDKLTFTKKITQSNAERGTRTSNLFRAQYYSLSSALSSSSSSIIINYTRLSGASSHRNRRCAMRRIRAKKANDLFVI